MRRPYAKFLTVMRFFRIAVLAWGLSAVAVGSNSESAPGSHPNSMPQDSSQLGSEYAGKTILAIELPRVADGDRDHLLSLLPLKEGAALDRDQVRASLRVLYGTGRFADIQAEVTPSGSGVVLSFVTSPNYFVGAIDVDGAPSRPSANQIVNSSKFQLGELYGQDKLARALENVRQLMQENGYYRARVTAETTSNLTTQQVDILFHIDAGAPAHVGEVTITGTSSLQSAEVQGIAHLRTGDRVTAARITDSLQRLRKRFQKQNRALAQVSIAEQKYQPESNTLNFVFQIEPGPVVLISARGFHISHGRLKKEVPVFEENAVDDDLLNEGKRNLLDYLQTRGHFDASVEIKKETDPKTLRIIYEIEAGPLHKLALIDISGNKKFLDTATLRSYLQIQPASRFLSHGRYSQALLRSDVATLEGLYKSNGFRAVKIDTKVDDNFQGSTNRLAVHIHIVEGVRTLFGEVRVAGNETVKVTDLPELSSQSGQPYSEQELANDRERILSYYYDHGFPNASLEVSTNASTAEANREDVTFTIQEGERFVVNQVMVGGLDHTRDFVVQRDLQVHTNDPLSQQDLLNTQTRLYNLGIFSQVDTAVQNPEGKDPQKNVLVQLREAKRYTFTYGLGFEFQTAQPAGSNLPQGKTGVSPRVEFDVTRLNFAGRNQTVTFQSHVGRLQQRGLISYTVPKLFNSDKLKLIYTIFYDNSLDVATFTSRRLEGKIDLRQQIGNAGTEPGTRPGPSSITYRFDFRRVEARDFNQNFTAGEISVLSLPARVGGPGFTFIRDKRDNPLESTKGNYFTLDGFTAAGFLGSEADFGRLLAQNSTYHAFGPKGKPQRQFVFARSTTIGIQQPFSTTRVRPPGACVTDPNTTESFCQEFPLIPLPEQFFAGGGNSHRGFGLNQAGPRDPSSGFPVGGTALFVNNLELRFPPVSLPYVGEGFGFAIFHDMGNVFTAPHDALTGLMRWHQPDPGRCLPSSTTNTQCIINFNNSGYDYTSHALGVGVRYKTPLGPLRFDFGYNLNPTRYFQLNKDKTEVVTQQLRRFNVFFSIGQPF